MFAGETEVVNMGRQSGNERMYSVKSEGLFFMDQVMNVVKYASFLQPKAQIRSEEEQITVSLAQDDQSRYLSHKNVMEKVVIYPGKSQFRVKFGK